MSCVEAECATPDYRRAECRVLAENQFARVSTTDGVEVRYQSPNADSDMTWIAAGLVAERDGGLLARVAHPGEFAISLRGGALDTIVEVELTNVHPRAEVRVGPAGAELVVPGPTAGTERALSVDVPAGELRWIRGTLSCPSTYTMAVLSDVQLNPNQFARILERLGQENSEAEAAGGRLVGVLMPGDLTESSREDEFRVFADLLDPAPVPFALTPGNHDVYDSDLPYYNQNFGPGNYAFDVCRTHVAMLDTGSGAIAPSIVGRLPELFAADGADHSLAVMHHPPFPGLTAAGWNAEDVAMITLGEFAHQRGDLVLAGHAHLLKDFRFDVAGRELRELIAGTAGAWQGAGEPIYGYLRLTFSSGEPIDACFVEVPPPGALPTAVLPSGLSRCE